MIIPNAAQSDSLMSTVDFLLWTQDSSSILSVICPEVKIEPDKFTEIAPVTPITLEQS